MTIPLPIIDSPVSFLKLVTTLFGALSAGVFWYDRANNRPRVRVHRVDEGGGFQRGWIATFELVNLGSAPTSLDPTVVLTAQDMFGRSIHEVLHWQCPAEGRVLQPAVPVVLEAADRGVTEDIIFSSFRRYYLRLSRGSRAVVRIEKYGSAPAGPIGFGLRSLYHYVDRRMAVRKVVRALANAKNPKDAADAAQPDTTE